MVEPAGHPRFGDKGIPAAAALLQCSIQGLHGDDAVELFIDRPADEPLSAVRDLLPKFKVFVEIGKLLPDRVFPQFELFVVPDVRPARQFAGIGRFRPEPAEEEAEPRNTDGALPAGLVRGRCEVTEFRDFAG